MGAVREFNFGDFKNEILSKLGVGSRALESRTNIKLIKSIFDSAAKNDGGEKAGLLETDMNGFQKLVDNTISALKNEGDKCWMEKILGSKLYQYFFPGPQNETEEVELVKVEAGLAKRIQDKPNSEYGEIKKLEKPSREEMISRLNKYLETPLSPEATEEEFRAALKEVAEKQQEVAKTQQEILEKLQALRDKEVEPSEPHFGLD